MDFFDERILTALQDGKPRSFTALLTEVGFSHNTLEQHLNLLISRQLVVKEKIASKSLGRPKFAYNIPPTATKQVNAALQNPYETLVTLQFSRRARGTSAGSRKAATAKKREANADPKTAPKSKNKNYDHF